MSQSIHNIQSVQRIWEHSKRLTAAAGVSPIRRSAISLVVALVLAIPLLSHAAPKHLRSDEDINDVVDAFMGDIVAGQVGSAYRGLAAHAPDLAPQLVNVISDVTLKRRELKTRIGLSLGAEDLGIERAGERVVRVTRLERFDEGALAWHLIFYRAELVWQVIDISFSEDLGVLFGDPPRVTSARPAHEPSDATPPAQEEADAPSGPAESGDAAQDAEPAFDYDIDLDGRL